MRISKAISILVSYSPITFYALIIKNNSTFFSKWNSFKDRCNTHFCYLFSKLTTLFLCSLSESFQLQTTVPRAEGLLFLVIAGRNLKL